MISRKASSRVNLALGALAAMPLFVFARADDATPDQVLKQFGVKRSGSSCILAEESIVKNKLNEARNVNRRLAEAIRQQRETDLFAQNIKEQIQQLTAERLELNQQLAAAGPGLSVQHHNQLVAMLNARSDRIRELDNQMPDAAVKSKIDEEIVNRREAFISAILSLRKTVDETNQKYAELAKDTVLQKALAAIAPRSKSPPKLGPSADFKNSIKQLETFEKLVLTDKVAVAQKGGVYEVQVTLNDTLTVPFVYDTGASFLTISSDVASRLGLQIAADDPTIRLTVADGTIIEAKKKTIRSVRVGRFTVNDVVCAVLPPGKAKIPLLLGQSFLRHFTVSGSPESGQLLMSRVGGEETRPNRGDAAKTTKKTRRGGR